MRERPASKDQASHCVRAEIEQAVAFGASGNRAPVVLAGAVHRAENGAKGPAHPPLPDRSGPNDETRCRASYRRTTRAEYKPDKKCYATPQHRARIDHAGVTR